MGSQADVAYRVTILSSCNALRRRLATYRAYVRVPTNEPPYRAPGERMELCRQCLREDSKNKVESLRCKLVVPDSALWLLFLEGE